ARVRNQRVGSAQPDPGLLVKLAQRGRPQRRLALALAPVHRTAWEYPGAAHEAGLRVAFDQQDLQAVRAASEHDHGRRQTRHGDLALVELLAGPGAINVHGGITLSGDPAPGEGVAATLFAREVDVRILRIYLRSRGRRPGRRDSAQHRV